MSLGPSVLFKRRFFFRENLPAARWVPVYINVPDQEQIGKDLGHMDEVLELDGCKVA